MNRLVQQRFFTLAGALLTLALSTQAIAEAGSWVVRGNPTLMSTGLLNEAGASFLPRHRIGGANLDMAGDDQLSFSISYFLTNRVSVEYLGARQFERSLAVRGVGDLGDAVRLPPTLTMRYHFRENAEWRPYVGAGINWTNTLVNQQALGQQNLSLENPVGYALQAGVYYDLSDDWVLNFEARYSDIDAELRANDRQVGRTDIDPLVVAVKLGYRF